MYLVLNAGSTLGEYLAFPELNGLVEDIYQPPFIEDKDSNFVSRGFNVLGVDDCLKLRGYCIVRS